MSLKQLANNWGQSRIDLQLIWLIVFLMRSGRGSQVDAVQAFALALFFLDGDFGDGFVFGRRRHGEGKPRKIITRKIGNKQKNSGVRQFSFCFSMDDIW